MVEAGLLMLGVLDCFVEVGHISHHRPGTFRDPGAFVEAQQGGRVAVFQPNGVYGFEVQVQNPDPRRSMSQV